MNTHCFNGGWNPRVYLCRYISYIVHHLYVMQFSQEFILYLPGPGFFSAFRVHAVEFQIFPFRIRGTGIFTYMKTINLSHSCR